MEIPKIDASTDEEKVDITKRARRGKIELIQADARKNLKKKSRVSESEGDSAVGGTSRVACPNCKQMIWFTCDLFFSK